MCLSQMITFGAKRAISLLEKIYLIMDAWIMDAYDSKLRRVWDLGTSKIEYDPPLRTLISQIGYIDLTRSELTDIYEVK